MLVGARNNETLHIEPGQFGAEGGEALIIHL
jgi:hypothetical protein